MDFHGVSASCLHNNYCAVHNWSSSLTYCSCFPAIDPDMLFTVGLLVTVDLLDFSPVLNGTAVIQTLEQLYSSSAFCEALSHNSSHDIISFSARFLFKKKVVELKLDYILEKK